MYDFDVRRGDGDEIELAIRDWNNKLNQEDFNKLAEEEHQRVPFREDRPGKSSSAVYFRIEPSGNPR